MEAQRGRGRRIQSEQTSPLIDNPLVQDLNVPIKDDVSVEEVVPQTLVQDVKPSHESISDLAINIPNGFHSIDTASRNGTPIRLFDRPEGEGTIAHWKKTRAFANATKRWEETGKWIDFMTGATVDFVPKFWKERFF